MQQQHCVFEVKLQHWYFGRKKKDLLRWQKEHVASPEKNRFLRLILVGRRKFKFLEAKFVFEAKMMKKLPKKSLCFSHHRWYLFFFTPPLIFFFSLHRWYLFFTPPLIYIFFLKQKEDICFTRKKRPQSIVFATFAFFCLLSVLW